MGLFLGHYGILYVAPLKMPIKIPIKIIKYSPQKMKKRTWHCRSQVIPQFNIRNIRNPPMYQEGSLLRMLKGETSNRRIRRSKTSTKTTNLNAEFECWMFEFRGLFKRDVFKPIFDFSMQLSNFHTQRPFNFMEF